jgi:hypothetical protein
VDTETDSVMKMAPIVMEKLRGAGFGNVVFNFFSLVCENRFPLRNIAFLLWIEVVNWYMLDITSGMRYMDETKKFWKLGWRHFGGKFVHFMSGFKNTSQIVFGESTRGQCTPDKSDINFAVPSVHFVNLHHMESKTNRENPVSLLT